MLRTRSVLILSALLTACLASGARAQTVEVGSNVAAPNGGDVPISEVRTDISLVPATATGDLDSASFQWSELGCMGAVKLKFFRRQVDALNSPQCARLRSSVD